MPPVLPFIPLIIGAATAGTSIYEAVNRPSAPAQLPAGPITTPAQSPTTNAAQVAQASSASSNVQAATGGSVGPEYLASILNTAFQGNPQATGNIQQAINQAFGLGAPGNTGITSGGAGVTAPSPTSGAPGNSITDLLAQAFRPNAGGGGAPGSSVAQSTLQQEFKGFS